MKSKEEFREKFKNGEFKEELKNLTSAEEVADFAQSLGYDVTVEDVLSEELDEDALSMVAGGKGNKHSTSYTTNYNIRGNNNNSAYF